MLTKLTNYFNTNCTNIMAQFSNVFFGSTPVSFKYSIVRNAGADRQVWESDAIRVEYDGASLRISALAPCLTVDGLADMVDALHHAASVRRLDVADGGGNERLRKTA